MSPATPGPVESIPITSTRTVFNSSITLAPDTLFRDGIHCIFGYLSQYDWWSAICVCRNWSIAAETEPNRQLSVPIQTKGVTIRMPPNYRFRSFIVDIFIHHRDCVQLSVPKLMALVDQLPNLQILIWTIPNPSPDLFQPHRWSHRLLHLKIDLGDLQMPHLLESIFELTSLTSLAIAGDSDGSYGRTTAPFTWSTAPWMKLSQLEYLEVVRISLGSIGACGIPIQFPPKLRGLAIRNHDWAMRDLPLFGNLNHVQHFSFDSNSILPGELAIIFNTLPGLVSLDQPSLSSTDLELIPQFKQLREMRLTKKPVVYPARGLFDPLVLMDDHTIISHLARCPSLTHLTLEETTLTSNDSWQLLTTSLPKLQIVTLSPTFGFRRVEGWPMVLSQLVSSTLIRLELDLGFGFSLHEYLHRLVECTFGCQQLEELLIRHWQQRDQVTTKLIQSILSDENYFIYDRLKARLPRLKKLILKNMHDPIERECLLGRSELRPGIKKMNSNWTQVIDMRHKCVSPSDNDDL